MPCFYLFFLYLNSSPNRISQHLLRYLAEYLWIICSFVQNCNNKKHHSDIYLYLQRVCDSMKWPIYVCILLHQRQNVWSSRLKRGTAVTIFSDDYPNGHLRFICHSLSVSRVRAESKYGLTNDPWSLSWFLPVVLFFCIFSPQMFPSMFHNSVFCLFFYFFFLLQKQTSCYCCNSE